jgi:hypothetical protein
MVQLERCKGICCPFSNYCMRHILNDKKQKLYGACQYLLVNDQTNQIPCRTPSYRPFGKNEVREGEEKEKKANVWCFTKFRGGERGGGGGTRKP